MNKHKDNTIDYIKNFVDTINCVEDEWNSVYDEIGKLDLEISDLLHEIELTDFNEVEGFQIAKEIQKIRKRRRYLKNYQEIIKYLKEFIDKNPSIKIPLFKVHTSIKKTFQYQTNRVYIPRVRNDLKLSLDNQQNSKDTLIIEDYFNIYEDPETDKENINNE